MRLPARSARMCSTAAKFCRAPEPSPPLPPQNLGPHRQVQGFTGWGSSNQRSWSIELVAAFIERVLRETGIDVQIIDSSEEARLIIIALLDRLNLAGLTVVHIEVGGGSVEVSLIEDGQIQFSLTHKLGAVRPDAITKLLL